MSEKAGRVLVAMSGGVDSSVAALLLQRQGYEVIGATMRLPQPDKPGGGGCCGIQGIDDARRVCDRLGIPFYPLNYEAKFEETVIAYLRAEYCAGRTPNPCTICNQYMKFGLMFDMARSIDAAYIATGHYARLHGDPDTDRFILQRGRDKEKDQTYFLFTLTQAQMAGILFPVGEYTKNEVRGMAREADLKVHAKPGSQDICFISSDYREFFEARGLTAGGGPGFTAGPIQDRDGQTVGEHSGIALYTIGQRKGIGAHGRRAYVTAIDPQSNTITIGNDKDLFVSQALVSEVNWISRTNPGSPFRAIVKIRYQHGGTDAEIIPLDDGRVRIEFDAPQRAVTPGQAAVIYEDDIVIAGGWICNGS